MDAQPAPPEQTVHPDEFRNAIGHFPTGVAVVTTAVDGEGHGATVSALASLSLEPPMLLVCLKHTSRTLSAIRRRGSFAVHLLAEDQAHVAAHFATREGAKITPPDGETPPRVPGAIGAIECEVESMVRGGSHLVVTAVVRRVEMSGGRPLTYYRGRFGGFVPALTLVKPSD